MVILIIFNISVKTVYAVPIAVPVGSYKLLQFLLICATVGIGFNAVREAEKLMEEFNSKYYGGNEPPNSKETIINLLGMNIVDSFFDIVNNIVDMFRDKPKNEGKNYYDTDVIIIDDEFEEQAFKLTDQKIIHYGGYNVYFKLIQRSQREDGTPLYKMDICTNAGCYDRVTDKFIDTNRDPNVRITDMYIDGNSIRINGRMFTIIYSGHYSTFRISLPLPGQYDDEPIGSIEYYLDRDSKLLTGEPVTESDIKYINMRYIPEDRLEREVTADGVKTYYNGTMEELINDIVEYTPWTQVVTDAPARVFENEEGRIEIDYNPQQELEPGPEPEPEPGPEPEDPYEIPDSDIRIDWSPLLKIDVTDKFPFSLPWDLKRIIEMLRAGREAPVWELPIKNEVIVIDFNNFEEIARIARSFNVIIFVVILIILTRRFISGA